MKLINCETRKIEEWNEGKQPPYAIVSHTWPFPDTEPGEVTYQDYLLGREATLQKNWTKIDKSIELTRKGKEKLKHVWIDTCCINKAIDKELSTAINSMFKWYAEAIVCYAQIADFKSEAVAVANGTKSDFELNTWNSYWENTATSTAETTAANVTPNIITGSDRQLSKVEQDRLRGCRWFTRGWTLQELIAPPRVEFFDANWTRFGSRDGLSDILSSITKIDKEVLVNPSNPHGRRDPTALLRKMTVAKKMSWARNRKTTETEDMAYSLLGIFDVSMPMLYGEGKKAFIRLQKEIVKDHNDLTLFAWQASDKSNHLRGILARSPEEFAEAGDFVLSSRAIFNPDFEITNKGLKISTQLRKIQNSDDLFLGLNCYKKAEGQDLNYGIRIKFKGAAGYVRTEPDSLPIQENGVLLPKETIFIASGDVDSDETVTTTLRTINNQSFRFIFAGTRYYEFTEVLSHKDMWNYSNGTFITQGLSTFNGCIRFQTKGFVREPKTDFVVACGFRMDSQVWVCIEQRGRPLYVAAEAQDWDRMGFLGRQQRNDSIRISYVGPDRFEAQSGLEVTASINRKALDGGEFFEVTVNASRFNNADSCDDCLVCCCTDQYRDDCVIL